MMYVLATGTLIADPVRRSGAKGDFATGTVRVATDDGPILISLIGFGAVAEQLLRHSIGNAVAVSGCQSARKRDPESASNDDPYRRLSSGRPRSPRRGPARVAQCPHERRSDARGEALWARGGDPRATVAGLRFGS